MTTAKRVFTISCPSPSCGGAAKGYGDSDGEALDGAMRTLWAHLMDEHNAEENLA